MKVLVTGADGFLGANLARALLSKGHSVRALVQPGRSLGTLDGLPAEVVTGDLFDEALVKAAVRGVEGVAHTVASTAVYPPRDPAMRTLNIDAALSLASAARDAGVGRFVHVGTANSFAPGNAEHPGHEGNNYDGARFGLDYLDTKKEAQDRMLELACAAFPVVVVNPTFMFGPYDSKPGSGAMILAVASGKVPGAAPGGRSFADVRGVALGIVAALERGRCGECYLLGGENLSYEEMFSLIAEIAGVPRPRLRLPPGLVVMFGALGSLAGSVTGKAPRVSVEMARISCESHFYSSAKAGRELGYQVLPIRSAVEDALAWFRERGML